MIWVLLQDGSERLSGIGGGALFQHLFGCVQRISQAVIRFACQVSDFLHESLDLGRRQRPLETVDRLPVEEGVDRRDRLNLQLSGVGRIGVDIDFHQLHATLGRCYSRLNRGAERLTWAAPWRPEIDDNRYGLRRLDNVFHKGRIGPVFDDICGGGSGR